MPNPRTCACGCGVELKRRGPTGPDPSYVDASHRKRAHRRRRAAVAGAGTVPNPKLGPISIGPNRPLLDQLQEALLELRAIGFTFDRLGRSSMPEVAYRCANVGTAITAAIAENFGEEATR